jgi:hypothetical protein
MGRNHGSAYQTATKIGMRTTTSAILDALVLVPVAMAANYQRFGTIDKRMVKSSGHGPVVKSLPLAGK